MATEDLLEDSLLSEGAVVDGHDYGAGEMNIFIYSDDPRTTFAEVRGILVGSEYWAGLRVAYRQIDSEDYTVVWPADLRVFTVT